MRLLFIRHAEPDYSIDSLTEKGWKEAELLSRRLGRLNPAAIYCFPMGRAKDTASFTLQKLGRSAEQLPWLEEFPCRIPRPDRGKPGIPWDLPDDVWTSHPQMYDKDAWAMDPLLQGLDDVAAAQRRVVEGFDALLERHGYLRSGPLYRPLRPNTDTLLLFCHLGVQFVLLSHLTGVAAPVLWQNFCVLPSSVTTVCSQQRQRDLCCFRVQSLGDTSHLYAFDEPPSSMGFFSEVFQEEP